ncbi:MAG TPA: aldo/keto reductase [Longimicrobiales bacterium]|nr:aldo/keto reductase [Longimicrobiales bacterium]
MHDDTASPDLSLETTRPLNHGGPIPLLGLGTFRSPAGEATRDAVRWALEAGYRHLDTAAAYGNEEDVGRGLRESGVPRDEVFVTTKLWKDSHGYDETLRAFDESLRRLGLDAVDLYLIHWPDSPRRLDSWRAMERILAEGRARAIGVSNYMIRHLEEVLEHGSVVPAVNQIELHPFNHGSRGEVLDFCQRHDIAVEGYSPLTKTRKLDEPTLVRIARARARTPAQVLIRWALQHGFITIPKSTHRDRIRENAAVFDFFLSDRDMADLDGLDEDFITSWDPRKIP